MSSRIYCLLVGLAGSGPARKRKRGDSLCRDAVEQYIASSRSFRSIM